MEASLRWVGANGCRRLTPREMLNIVLMGCAHHPLLIIILPLALVSVRASSALIRLSPWRHSALARLDACTLAYYYLRQFLHQPQIARLMPVQQLAPRSISNATGQGRRRPDLSLWHFVKTAKSAPAQRPRAHGALQSRLLA